MNLPPIFDIVKYVENIDGSATLEVESTDEFVKLYKKLTGKKRATQKGMEKFLRSIIVEIAKMSEEQIQALKNDSGSE